MLGLEGAMKPFECVRTPKEVKLAVHMCRKLCEEHGRVRGRLGSEGKVPYLLSSVKAMEEREVEEAMMMLDDYNPDHLLPTWFTHHTLIS